MPRRFIVLAFALANFLPPGTAHTQETRLLREPTLSADNVAFCYGSDLWIVPREGGLARRLTSTAAVESDPHFSPDGRALAFTSNRSGVETVYVLPVEGGTPRRLTWYPAPALARGWSANGDRILYASTRETAPAPYHRLWTVSPEGGPSTLLPIPAAFDGSFAPGGTRLVYDRVSRWDSEWRGYRGGQNTPLTILELDGLEETRLPNERTMDIEPLWLGGKIYFLSDRDWATNVWSYDPSSGVLDQLTHFADADVKRLDGHAEEGEAGTLVFEQDGWLHLLDLATGAQRRLEITVRGDFPWAETRWEDVSERPGSASLSPTGKRALFAARGEIFTVPAEKGDVRNLTRSSGADDRAPVWSPDGSEIAWFSDDGNGYTLMIAKQDGLEEPRRLPIGVSRMAWEPTWSPDGSRIAFVDDDVRVQVIELENGEITTADIGGVNIERGSMGLRWSHDSRWLAYAKTYPNNLRRIVVWSRDDGSTMPLTDRMADAISPAWDRDGKHLYFLASTDVALASGWANTSTIHADPTYGAYVAVLEADANNPFALQSDEEAADAGPAAKDEEEEARDSGPGGAASGGAEEHGEAKDDAPIEVHIDRDGIERRILDLPVPVAHYRQMLAGPKGSVFLAVAQEESSGPGSGLALKKFTLEEREAKTFASGVRRVAVSEDGKKLLFQSGQEWRIVGTAAPPENGKGGIDVTLRMQLDRTEEWRQIFAEAWHYERDFFYDPGMHGNDWQAVRARYEPLVPYVRHRADLNYVLDQLNGELSVGHSFVFGGDLPEVDPSSVGVLGADIEPADGRWRIARILTFESWNPKLTAPLDQPDLRVAEGNYLVGVNGVELTAADDPYSALDGTASHQTVLHLNDRPTMDGAWTITVEPAHNEDSLRQRAWVEDNRRRVDELSDGKLAYVWVPNTGNGGVVSFDRYYFAQQDKLGAVIDERYNRGGLLDDYMVDLMTRSLRAAVTNEVPNGAPFRLPAGILGPKILLINELAGSGGDFFPWVFRHQHAGPLIGTRTWGGLVKSSVHYPLVDGGALTAPDNAVFDPKADAFIAENRGVPPNTEVPMDARSVAQGRDPQLEAGVREALRLLDEQGGGGEITPPPFPRPSRRP